MRDDALEIFNSAVTAVLPSELIRSNITVNSTALTIAGRSFILDKLGRVILIGAGKASAAMALECEDILGNDSFGYVITKDDHTPANAMAV